MQKFENGAIGAGLRPAFGCCGAVALALLVAVASPVAAAPQEATDPRLVEISKEHCLAFYDAVELQLKGKGDEVTSVTTRNGLKDFFVVRPGEVDCTGEREIPWRDDKDRNFIKSVLEAAGDGLKPKVNLMETYAIGPAPRATVPRR